ncbi:unnamed protein product [Lepeophtheirus salmonis]|uniref:(salmon louse) hypothetical protein n=1 Tax=Lepeophtheirus salmonis TaxID=72036 RepID=A0A7R8CFM3_LEPSM|nr:unnamed protein product [Lepeophtheirus salmonis]CAF2761425.1 unnamed protein product [Lepeophtheirus salmonis]
MATKRKRTVATSRRYGLRHSISIKGDTECYLLALDESTDIRDTTQLAVFIRAVELGPDGLTRREPSETCLPIRNTGRLSGGPVNRLPSSTSDMMLALSIKESTPLICLRIIHPRNTGEGTLPITEAILRRTIFWRLG